MEIITGTTQFKINEKTAVAIGKFDGIHVGHKKLLSYILEQKKDGLKSVVFTFDPSPEEFFMGKRLPQLFTRDEKRRAFEKMGIDVLLEFPLTEITAATEPEDFVKRILVSQLSADYIAAGVDVSFGNRGRGDRHLLAHLSKEFGYELELIDKVRVDDEEVSSTRVRNEVSDGNMKMAARLLGEEYSVSGTVVHGRHIGHTIGVPTANIHPEENKLLPPFGVYKSVVVTRYGMVNGMTNIGRKPTISDREKVGVETYLYDFDRDLYDSFIEVKLLSFMRPEMKFDSVDDLKKQIKSDVEGAWN